MQNIPSASGPTDLRQEDAIYRAIDWASDQDQAIAVIAKCITLLGLPFLPSHKEHFEQKFDPWQNDDHPVWERLNREITLPGFSLSTFCDDLWQLERSRQQKLHELAVIDLQNGLSPPSRQELDWLSEYHQLMHPVPPTSLQSGHDGEVPARQTQDSRQQS